MQSLIDIKKDELETWLNEREIPRFVADQIYQWVFEKKVLSWEAMSNIKKSVREQLKVAFSLQRLKELKQEVSSDNETIKFLFELEDKKRIEAVLIQAPGRNTICVSSQVGCPARCAFCASGKAGLFRNLSTHEIIEQVIQITAFIEARGETLTNIVYMGMGEPLENRPAVFGSIDVLVSIMKFSARRITVSTVGVVEGILDLARQPWKVNLALSLHAPNQELRKKLIPYARRYDLKVVLEAIDTYIERTRRDVTFEYTLLDGINADKKHAEELAVLARNRACSVNLIPYNPVIGLKLQRPPREVIETFQRTLEKRHIVATCRYTKGDDIAAACGQLAINPESWDKKIEEAV